LKILSRGTIADSPTKDHRLQRTLLGAAAGLVLACVPGLLIRRVTGTHQQRHGGTRHPPPPPPTRV